MTLTKFVCQHLSRYGEGFDAGRRAMLEDFTDSTVWENVGLSRTVGADEAIGILELFRDRYGMDRLEIEILSVAETGTDVLTERVDHVLRADGSVIASIRLMGIIRVEAGKIVAWRDYFNTAALPSPA